MRQDKSSGLAPDQSALQGEIGEIIREVIEHDLTDKQRHVLIMMVFNEVPMDEVVQQLGTNRNAIYKMLHDARRKLKSGVYRHAVLKLARRSPCSVPEVRFRQDFATNDRGIVDESRPFRKLAQKYL